MPDPLWPAFAYLLRRDGYVGFQVLDQMPHIPGVIDSAALAMADKDRNLIYLRGDLADGQLRACVGHEMFHLLDPDAGETEVEHRTARTMVPLSAALAARTPEQLDDVARVLRVDRKLVLSRLACEADAIRREAG